MLWFLSTSSFITVSGWLRAGAVHCGETSGNHSSWTCWVYESCALPHKKGAAPSTDTEMFREETVRPLVKSVRGISTRTWSVDVAAPVCKGAFPPVTTKSVGLPVAVQLTLKVPDATPLVVSTVWVPTSWGEVHAVMEAGVAVVEGLATRLGVAVAEAEEEGVGEADALEVGLGVAVAEAEVEGVGEADALGSTAGRVRVGGTSLVAADATAMPPASRPAVVASAVRVAVMWRERMVLPVLNPISRGVYIV